MLVFISNLCLVHLKQCLETQHRIFEFSTYYCNVFLNSLKIGLSSLENFVSTYICFSFSFLSIQFNIFIYVVMKVEVRVIAKFPCVCEQFRFFKFFPEASKTSVGR